MDCRVYVHDACAAISGHISRVVLYFVQTSWVYDAVNMRLVCASVCMRAAVCRRVSHVLAVHVLSAGEERKRRREEGRRVRRRGCAAAGKKTRTPRNM